ncbi:MAG: short-chain dehydrogenase, partial [bacterium]|nr:short-chain dehydrogenase [bacterium]
VGQAITRALLHQKPKTLILASLYEHETAGLAESLQKEFSNNLPALKLAWGNLLVRQIHKDIPKQELIDNVKIRRQMIADLLEPFNRDILTQSALHHLLQEYQPDIVIDTFNFATALPFNDGLMAAREVFGGVKKEDFSPLAAEKFILSQESFQLTRHLQTLFNAMIEAKTKMYVKIGSTGHYGMKPALPSRPTLLKTALAGAHSLLLHLASQTDGAPIIKEIKPKAIIAWKNIGFGPITYRGRAVLLEEMNMPDALLLTDKLTRHPTRKSKYLKHAGEPMALTAPFIDIGENGSFAMEEFHFLTAAKKMGFATPQDVAETAIAEIAGKNTGLDAINAIDHAAMGPTYRAGLAREKALKALNALVEKSGVESIAFQLMGPPRLSKLLYEAYLLRLVCGSARIVLDTETETLCKNIEKKLAEKSELISNIISIGIPILLSKGNRILRGSRMSVPFEISGKPENHFEVTEANINRWAFEGWVDLRPQNIAQWQEALQKMPAKNLETPIKISTAAALMLNR